jgi:two-component system sensor histidine kinase AlgZ
METPTDSELSCEHEAPDLAAYLRGELWSDALSCLAIAAVLTLLLAPFMTEGRVQWLPAFTVYAVISLCIGLSVSNGYRFALPLLRRRFPGTFAYLVLFAILGLGFTALGVEIAVRAVEAIGGMPADDMRPHVLRIGLVVVIIAVAIEMTHDRLRLKARAHEMRAEQARKEALRAQLKALQARTNPHFLFNSLNTVAGLIEEDPSGAERVLERLGELFRYALKGSEGGWVRLGEELAAVEGYLEVESIRFGGRLRSEVRAPSETREILVPPLILQPLVENAVLHAIAPRREGGTVRIAARLLDGSLVLTVADDGSGPGTSPHNGSGTSLAELEQRLELIYGGAARFEAGGSEGSGFLVELALPLEAPA